MRTKIKHWIVIAVSVIIAIFTIAVNEYLFWLFAVLIAVTPLVYPGAKKAGVVGKAKYIRTIYIVAVICVITVIGMAIN